MQDSRNARSVLFLLRGSAYRIGSGGGKDGSGKARKGSIEFAVGFVISPRNRPEVHHICTWVLRRTWLVAAWIRGVKLIRLPLFLPVQEVEIHVRANTDVPAEVGTSARPREQFGGKSARLRQSPRHSIGFSAACLLFGAGASANG